MSSSRAVVLQSLAAFHAGLLAAFLAKGTGIPLWRTGWDLAAVGDQTDCFMVAAFAVWFAIGALRQPR